MNWNVSFVHDKIPRMFSIVFELPTTPAPFNFTALQITEATPDGEVKQVLTSNSTHI